MNILRLIRYKNLLFVALIQVLIYTALILPTLHMYGLTLSLPVGAAVLMILATTLIAAGGYVINDYFDIKIDRINRPERLIVGQSMGKRTVMLLYQIVTATGIVAGIIVAAWLHSFTLAFVFVVTPGMLWFYSASYKRQLIIGNLIVALAAALVPIMPLLAMHNLLTTEYGDLIYRTPVLHHLYLWVGGFAVFAFAWTLIREIIKDLQDLFGDREMECHTMPVVWGEHITKIIVIALVFVVVSALLWIASYTHIGSNHTAMLRYAIWGNALPSICLVVVLLSRMSHAYLHAGNLAKFIMLIGTLFCIVYYYLLAQQYGLDFFGIFTIKQ